MRDVLPHTERQTSLIAVTSFCIIISTFAVILRLLARRQFHIKLWWDDYIAVIALVRLPLSRRGRSQQRLD
jgi:hypothetical protein